MKRIRVFSIILLVLGLIGITCVDAGLFPQGTAMDGTSRSVAPPRPAHGHALARTNDVVMVSSPDPYASARSHFKVASTMALCNILMNSLRPDFWHLWPIRIPRLLWELAIYITAMRALPPADSGVLHSGPWTRLVLLFFMALWTALVDLFFWAPVATGSILVGGWHDVKWFYIPVAVQCVLSGIVYLGAAVAAFDAASRMKQHEKLAQQQHMMEHIVSQLQSK